MPVYPAFPPEGHAPMLQPAYASSSSSGSGLKTTIVVIGVISLLFWCTSMGFLVAWGYSYFAESPREVQILYGNFLSVPANAAMVYTTARIIFLVMEEEFPLPGSLQDLSRCASRMLAFSFLSLTAWVGSIVWLVSISDTTNFLMYHACNYGFILGALVAALAGVLVSNTRRAQRQGALHMKNTAHIPQAHYNPAYAPPYTEHA